MRQPEMSEPKPWPEWPDAVLIHIGKVAVAMLGVVGFFVIIGIVQRLLHG